METNSLKGVIDFETMEYTDYHKELARMIIYFDQKDFEILFNEYKKLSGKEIDIKKLLIFLKVRFYSHIRDNNYIMNTWIENIIKKIEYFEYMDRNR